MVDTCRSYEDPNWGCVTVIMPFRDLDIGNMASVLVVLGCGLYPVDVGRPVFVIH